jgi:hypothetical protein
MQCNVNKIIISFCVVELIFKLKPQLLINFVKFSDISITSRELKKSQRRKAAYLLIVITLQLLNMAGIYMVSAQKPTAVTHSILG